MAAAAKEVNSKKVIQRRKSLDAVNYWQGVVNGEEK